MNTKYTFHDLKVWRWNNGKDAASWYFVTLPADVAEELHVRFAESKRGFGSLKVEVIAGTTSWCTSLFPDKENDTFILPIKKSVRIAEDVEEGSLVNMTIEVLL